MSDLFTSTRVHDLPPKWDGHPVEWRGWKVVPSVFVCHPPKREPCHACGSLAESVMNVGTVHISLAGIPRIGRARARTVQKRLIAAFRCPDCRADQVWDQEAWWDLDSATDYGDEGSHDDND